MMATIAEPVIAARIKYTRAATSTVSRIPIIFLLLGYAPSLGAPSKYPLGTREKRFRKSLRDEHGRSEPHAAHQHAEIRVAGAQAARRHGRTDRAGCVRAVDRQAIPARPAGREVRLVPVQGEDAAAVIRAVAVAAQLVDHGEAARGRLGAGTPDRDAYPANPAAAPAQLDPASGQIGVERVRRPAEVEAAALHVDPRELA